MTKRDLTRSILSILYSARYCLISDCAWARFRGAILPVLLNHIFLGASPGGRSLSGYWEDRRFPVEIFIRPIFLRGAENQNVPELLRPVFSVAIGCGMLLWYTSVLCLPGSEAMADAVKKGSVKRSLPPVVGGLARSFLVLGVRPARRCPR